jgi:hypothetical protein
VEIWLQTERVSKMSIMVWIGVLVGTGIARAEEWEASWRPDPGCEGEAELRYALAVRGWYRAGYVPPFRVAERDRLAMGVQGCMGIGSRVQVAADWDWLRDASAASIASGPGDIRLGTSVALIERRGERVQGAMGLGWAVKLPDAEDEEELGTDETDVDIGAWGQLISGPWRLEAGIALAIWGNPLRFANQDDLVLLQLEGGWSHGAISLGPVVLAVPESDRNPTRISTDFFLQAGSQWFVRAQGGAGWAPASPDWQGGVSLGWRGASQGP